MPLLPQDASYRAENAIDEIADLIADPVEAAQFPKAILRFRNDRWSGDVGLGHLSDEEWVRHFARFEPLPDNLPQPLALRYHGHQFRVYNPDIGDGRGFLFAQLRDSHGRLLDLGTKGSGQTPYSRFGDGRLTLKGGVREILATEMLEALGVDTSKTFSLIETGEELVREDEPSPARSCVLVRLSHGHIRIGSFQRLATIGDREGLGRLVAYSLKHYYGEEPGDDAPAQLLAHVVRRTAELAAGYMTAGFVHGVLNSDNINITGESFDYGPWRFTPMFDPGFTAAYFDQQGLYAFARQAEAIQWDLVQLVVALNQIAASEALAPLVIGFGAEYRKALVAKMLWRLGVNPRGEPEDIALVQSIEKALVESHVEIDRFFFDWRGGRMRSVPLEAGTYSTPAFKAFQAALAGYEPSAPTDHPYWTGDNPCSMHIDEVESIWASISQYDDWAPLHAKIDAIRRMGEALEPGYSQGVPARPAVVEASPEPEPTSPPAEEPEGYSDARLTVMFQMPPAAAQREPEPQAEPISEPEVEAESEAEIDAAPEPADEPLSEPEAEAGTEIEVAPEAEAEAEIEVAPEVEAEPEPDAEPELAPKLASQPDETEPGIEPEPVTEPEIEPEPESEPDSAPEPQPILELEPEAELAPVTEPEPTEPEQAAEPEPIVEEEPEPAAEPEPEPEPTAELELETELEPEAEPQPAEPEVAISEEPRQEHAPVGEFEPEPELEPEKPEPEPEEATLAEPEAEAAVDEEPEPEAPTEPSPEPEASAEPTPEPEPVPEPESEPPAEVQSEPEIEAEPKAEPEPEPEPEAEPIPQPLPARAARLDAASETMLEPERMDAQALGGDIISTEPATGALLWARPRGDADAEVAIARAAWAGWASQSLAYRIEAVRRFANVVRNKTDKFAELIARETGKPLWEAKTEVDTVVNKVDISVKSYHERTAVRRLEGAMGARAALRHKPHGVLAVLGPYNFPAHLPNGHIVPALIAGNAVVFKPSEKTPAVGAMLVESYHEAGIPEGVVRLLVGGPEEGRALAGHAGIDGLLFTGSARAGMALHRQFADHPEKILALEMGGNNPLVVWDLPEVETDNAAVIAVQSAYMSAGQRCTAARRLIVQDGKHEKLVEAIAKIIDKLIVDEPLAKPQPFLGPVIDNGAASHLVDGFRTLVDGGGRVIRPLDRRDPDKPFLSPALIDVTDVAERPDEELFGPILQIVRVPDFEAAIAEANDTRYGLSASLVGGGPELYDRFWAEIRAGIVNWNRPTNGASSAAPFGGIGLSGNHRPSAYYAADYCAYPVASSEADSPRASLSVGVKEA